MKHIFVDTSAWDALADKADKNHAKALQFRDEIAGECKLVTSNYILDELHTLLLMNVGYQPTIDQTILPFFFGHFFGTLAGHFLRFVLVVKSEDQASITPP